MVANIFRVIGILVFGYLTLSMIGGMIIFQQEPDAPVGMIMMFLVIGGVSGYITRLLWKQIRSSKSSESKELK